MSSNSSLTIELKRYARSLGVDLIGVADVNFFKDAPEGHRPQEILPACRTVVVVAVRQPRAIVRFGLPSIYTRSIHSTAARLDNQITPALALFLEDKGYDALPVPARNPYMVRNTGDISHKHAAVGAGLGQIGMNTLLITPEFGSNINLASVLTTAPLDPDQPFSGKLCTECGKCVENCPVQALSYEGKINKAKCRGYYHVAPHNTDAYCLETFGLYNCWTCRKLCPFSDYPKNRPAVQ